VPSLDRLSRSLQDLIGLVAELRRRGVGFSSLHEALDTTTPGGKLVFHVFAALAEFCVISTGRDAALPDVRAAA
jgi:DNA invertase Pin-like site-specific DNA recombinase